MNSVYFRLPLVFIYEREMQNYPLAKLPFVEEFPVLTV